MKIESVSHYRLQSAILCCIFEFHIQSFFCRHIDINGWQLFDVYLMTVCNWDNYHCYETNFVNSYLLIQWYHEIQDIMKQISIFHGPSRHGSNSRQDVFKDIWQYKLQMYITMFQKYIKKNDATLQTVSVSSIHLI